MTGGLELSGRVTFILIVLIVNITVILSLELDTNFLPQTADRDVQHNALHNVTTNCHLHFIRRS